MFVSFQSSILSLQNFQAQHIHCMRYREGETSRRRLDWCALLVYPPSFPSPTSTSTPNLPLPTQPSPLIRPSKKPLNIRNRRPPARLPQTIRIRTTHRRRLATPIRLISNRHRRAIVRERMRNRSVVFAECAAGAEIAFAAEEVALRGWG